MGLMNQRGLWLSTLGLLALAGACTDLTPGVAGPGPADADVSDADVSGATGGQKGGDGAMPEATGGDTVTGGDTPATTGGAATPATGGAPVEVEVPECATDADCDPGFACSAGSCLFVPPERVPSTVVQTAGGGITSGSGLRVQLRIGAPVPAGRMGGGGNQVTLGPLSGGY